MESIIKMLDSSLDYISHELIDNTLYINVISNKHDLKSPNCGTITNKVHILAMLKVFMTYLYKVRK